MCDDEPKESLLIVELGGPAAGGTAQSGLSGVPRALSQEACARVVETAAALSALGSAYVDRYADAVRKAADSADWAHVTECERAALSAFKPGETPWWKGAAVEVAFGSAIVKAHDLTASACAAAERSAYGLWGTALGYCVLAAVRDAAIASSPRIALAGVTRVPSSSLAHGFHALPSQADFADVSHMTDVLVVTSDEHFRNSASGAILVQQVAEATRRSAFEVHGGVPLVRCLYQVSAN